MVYLDYTSIRIRVFYYRGNKAKKKLYRKHLIKNDNNQELYLHEPNQISQDKKVDIYIYINMLIHKKKIEWKYNTFKLLGKTLFPKRLVL